MCGQLLLVKSWCGERGNSLDIYAASVMKDSVVVGHLPRKISPVASLFLNYERQNDSVSCLGKMPASSAGVHMS